MVEVTYQFIPFQQKFEQFQDATKKETWATCKNLDSPIKYFQMPMFKFLSHKKCAFCKDSFLDCKLSYAHIFFVDILLLEHPIYSFSVKGKYNFNFRHFHYSLKRLHWFLNFGGNKVFSLIFIVAWRSKRASRCKLNNEDLCNHLSKNCVTKNGGATFNLADTL